MKIRLKLRKIGNSAVITIPSQVIDDLDLKIGAKMLLDIQNSSIIIKKEEIITKQERSEKIIEK